MAAHLVILKEKGGDIGSPGKILRFLMVFAFHLFNDLSISLNQSNVIIFMKTILFDLYLDL